MCPVARREVGLLAAAACIGWLPFLWRPLSPDEGGFLIVASQWAPGSSLYGDYWVDRPPVLIGLFALADGLGDPWALRLLGTLAVVATVLLAGVVGRLAAPTTRIGPVLAAGTAAIFAATPLFGGSVVHGELLALPFILAGPGRGRRGLDGAVRPPRARAWRCSPASRARSRPSPSRARSTSSSPCWSSSSSPAASGCSPAWSSAPLSPWPSRCRSATASARPPGTCGTPSSPSAARPPRSSPSRPPSTTPRRFAGVMGALAASAAPFVAVALLVRLRGAGDVRRPSTCAGRPSPCSRWELVVVLLGGSYWLHYLMGLVPGPRPPRGCGRAAPLEAGPDADLPVRRRRRLHARAIVYVVAVPIDRPEAPVIDYLKAEARPGDTAVVAFGGANILRETGMTSPYEELWSLPVRVRDPDLKTLTAVLDGPGRPDLGDRQRRLARHLGSRRDPRGPGAPGPLPARRQRRHVLDLRAGRMTPRRLMGAAYVVALVLWSALIGIPNDPLGILLWGWLALFIAGRHDGFWRDWRPYVGAIVAYWLLRGLADETFIDTHFGYTVRFDRWLGGLVGDGRTPTEQLQGAWCGVPCLKTGAPHWWDFVLNTVYASHFYVAVLLGLALWVRDKDAWRAWMAAT